MRKINKQVLNQLVQVKREKVPRDFDNYILSINGLELKDKKFVNSVKEYKFPNFTRLHIQNMEFIEEEYEEGFHEFFGKSAPYCARQLYIHGSMDKCPKIDRFMFGIDTMLSCISEIVFFHSFEISPKFLKCIIESSSLVNKLVIYWCKCKIDSSFTIDSNIEFKINTLDLFRTCCEDDEDSINKYTLPMFVEALSKSKIKDSLRTVHLREQDYKSAKAQKIFVLLGFRVRIYADEEYPMIKKI